MSDGRSAALAAAKVNLALHVLGRRADGLHELESLIAFADIGDRIGIRAAAEDGLAVAGPFAAALGGSCASIDNLALRAVAEFRATFGGPGRHVTLDKRLPIAAGIGGGSADAAAVLRLLAAETGIERDDPRLAGLARGLGADVPACLADRPCVVYGAGETVVPLTAFPAVPVVLANPGVAVATADVFRRWAAAPVPPPGRLDPSAIAAAKDARAMARVLDGTMNMLEPAATAIVPEIARVLARLAVAGGCLTARMSGSGGTCFGLFAAAGEAREAAGRIAAEHPGWWVAAASLRGATPSMVGA